MTRLRFLKRMDCRDNPCAAVPKFWERVVTASSTSLGVCERACSVPVCVVGESVVSLPPAVVPPFLSDPV